MFIASSSFGVSHRIEKPLELGPGRDAERNQITAVQRRRIEDRTGRRTEIPLQKLGVGARCFFGAELIAL